MTQDQGPIGASLIAWFEEMMNNDWKYVAPFSSLHTV